MTNADDLRAWIRESRSAQGLPPRPTREEIARIVVVVGNGTAKNGKAAVP